MNFFILPCAVFASADVEPKMRKDITVVITTIIIIEIDMREMQDMQEMDMAVRILTIRTMVVIRPTVEIGGIINQTTELHQHIQQPMTGRILSSWELAEHIFHDSRIYYRGYNRYDDRYTGRENQYYNDDRYSNTNGYRGNGIKWILQENLPIESFNLFHGLLTHLIISFHLRKNCGTGYDNLNPLYYETMRNQFRGNGKFKTSVWHCVAIKNTEESLFNPQLLVDNSRDRENIYNRFTCHAFKSSHKTEQF